VGGESGKLTLSGGTYGILVLGSGANSAKITTVGDTKSTVTVKDTAYGIHVRTGGEVDSVAKSGSTVTLRNGTYGIYTQSNGYASKVGTVGDGGDILLLAQAGDGEGVTGAHGPDHPGHGVSLLVVQFRFHGGDQVPLLALHEVGEEGAACRGGVQEELLQQRQHGLQDLVPREGEPVFHKAAVEANGLDIADPADQGADGGTVERVQPMGDGAHIRAAFCAAQQHRGQMWDNPPSHPHLHYPK
jgi:hypothetical protein